MYAMYTVASELKLLCNNEYGNLVVQKCILVSFKLAQSMPEAKLWLLTLMDGLNSLLPCICNDK